MRKRIAEKIRRYGYLLLVPAVLLSCVKDKPADPATPPPASGGERLYIANEGSLGNGNASLSLYRLDEGQAYNDVYRQKNGQPLGDILQSMLVDGNLLYLAVNNSDKIVVVDKNDFSLKGTIPVRKPRYMLKVSEEKMYVSCLYYPEINIVNPKTMQVTGKINIDYPNSEGMTFLNGKVYACNWDTACHHIYEIDPANDAITRRLPIAGAAGQQVLTDKNQKLWVLAGNVYKQKTASLTQIDPISGSMVKSFVFPAGADVMKPCWNPSKDTLYYLGVNYNGGTAYNGVYRMDINASALPENLLIPAQALQYFWSLGVDPATNRIYVGDPKGFIQQGNVSVYQTNGSLIQSFTVGLGPGYFCFDR
jgi:DNA-binding beta-propeller fold protein YncE